MKTKTRELREMASELAKYSKTTNAKIAYFVAVNLSRIGRELEAADKVINNGWPTSAWTAYENAVNKIKREHAMRDADGGIMQDPIPGRPGMFSIKLKDVAGYNEKIEELNKHHMGAITDGKARDARELELLEQEVEWREHRLPASVAADACVLTAESIAAFMRFGLIEDEE